MAVKVARNIPEQFLNEKSSQPLNLKTQRRSSRKRQEEEEPDTKKRPSLAKKSTASETQEKPDKAKRAKSSIGVRLKKKLIETEQKPSKSISETKNTVSRQAQVSKRLSSGQVVATGSTSTRSDVKKENSRSSSNKRKPEKLPKSLKKKSSVEEFVEKAIEANLRKSKSKDVVLPKKQKVEVPAIAVKVQEINTGGSKTMEKNAKELKAPRRKMVPADAIGITSEFQEEKILTLRKIVEQAESDRKIFCIFDNHRYINVPIREELIRRGWLEYLPERENIPRRLRAPPQPQRDPIKIDHTIASIQKGIGNYSKNLHVTPPEVNSAPSKDNSDILEYGSRHQLGRSTILSSTSLTSNAVEPSFNKVQINQIIQELNAKIALVWLSTKPNIQLPYFSYSPQFTNKFQKTTFCSKFGLWYNLRTFKDTPADVVHPLRTPRMYNLGDEKNENEFIFDFHMTAVMSLLRWFVTRVTYQGVGSVQDAQGTVPSRLIEFALRKAKLFITYTRTSGLFAVDDIMGHEKNWTDFLFLFNKVINEGERLKPTPSNEIESLHNRARQALSEVKLLRRDMEYDGTYNIWIVKPYSAACGRGIFLTNNVFYIRQLYEKKYIIQKYIERPFLIANTKFDIRQWFLLTSLRPLEFWIYRESYLRFCSMPYDLNNLHEAVHLSNNAIQRKYTKDISLPHQNMWDSTTFQKYLCDIGQENLWQERIFPGMRDAITCVLLSSQSTFDRADPPDPPRSDWFEIYGADFMMTANLADGPWLIEINESPAMDPSTPITARLCQQMLRDVIKVVFDRREDPKASTGGWQMGYRQKCDPQLQLPSSSCNQQAK